MEFNSLSVVYGKPSESFLRDQQLKQSVAAEKKYYPKERGFKTSDAEKQLLKTEENEAEPVQEMDLLGGMGGTETGVTNAPVDLLDTGLDLLGGGGPSQP